MHPDNEFPARPDLLPELVGVTEIAARLGLTPGAVSVWRSRGRLLPPDVELAMGPLWLWARVEAWARANGTLPA